MFNKSGESKMAKIKGFALVAGDRVLEVLRDTSLRDAMAKQIQANKYAPIVRVRLAYCTIDGEAVKIGKFI